MLKLKPRFIFVFVLVVIMTTGTLPSQELIVQAYMPSHTGSPTHLGKVRPREVAQQSTERQSLEAAEALFQLGIKQYRADQWSQTLVAWEKALNLFQQLGEQQREAKLLGAVGVVYKQLGLYEKSLNYQQQSLQLNRQLQNPAGEAASLLNIGILYDLQGDYAQSIRHYEQSRKISRHVQAPRAELRVLANLGITYKKLGSYEQALESYQRSLELLRGRDDLESEAKVLNNMGEVYRSQVKYGKALEYFEQSLTLKQQLRDRPGAAATLSNIGIVYQSLKRFDKAWDAYQSSLEIRRDIGSPAGEVISLNNLGSLSQLLDDDAKALEYFQQSLAIARLIGDRASEASILSNLGSLYESQEQPILAILFLKQSVNKYEAIRTDNQSLSTKLQQSYTTTVADTYRDLADILLQQNRVLEAQRILDLLKVQEAQDYVGSFRGNAQTASGIEFNRSEQEILEKFNSIQNSTIQIAQRIASLTEKDTNEELNSQEFSELAELVQVQEDILTEFNKFTKTPDIQKLLQQQNQVKDNSSIALGEFKSLGDELKQLNAVLIYPLVLDDRIELIITTPDSIPVRRTVENVGRAELNKVIASFREELRTPFGDAKPSAHQLYRWLIEPLESDLAESNPETILYAPDGPLRYIPLAALYDSADPEQGQWLIERFKINNITAKSLQKLDSKPSLEPRIIAGAFADESTLYSVNVGSQTFNFRGLPFAGYEVKALKELLSNIRILLNEDFSLAALKPRLRSSNIIHFATHASLVPKAVGQSFILFGNGEKATIEDIENWPIGDIDLVVLSACETGLGGFNNNGEQILGLGYQFQEQGARAAIASLWQVDDGGTQVLMNAFYLALSEGYSKAESLQIAQQSLLSEDVESAGKPTKASVQVINKNPKRSAGFQKDLTHPHYWAPFILIGNGL